MNEYIKDFRNFINTQINDTDKYSLIWLSGKIKEEIASRYDSSAHSESFTEYMLENLTVIAKDYELQIPSSGSD